MDKHFFCYGTWDDMEMRCLKTCPDRDKCKKKTEAIRIFTNVEKEIKKGDVPQMLQK